LSSDAFNIGLAETAARSDTHTSVDIDGVGNPQIQRASGAVNSIDNLVYATVPTTTGAKQPLNLDLLVPATGPNKPL
jgi:hypothetical protein